MNLKQIKELCNAYQKCLWIEDILNKSVCNILDCDSYPRTEIVRPIKENIINCFCCGITNDKYEEMVYNHLEGNEPEELYNLFELMKGVYS